jgi:hypothetical protein
MGRQVDLLSAKLGLAPDLAATLLAAQPIEYDDEDNPIDLEKALKALTAKWPQLVKPAAQPPAGSTNAGDGTGRGHVDPKAKEADLKQRYRIQ